MGTSPPDAPLWTPPPERTAAAQLSRFIAETRARSGAGDYGALYEWSLRAPAEFWGAVAEFVDLRLAAPWKSVVEDADRMPGARWFDGAQLNFAENLLQPRFTAPAVVSLAENGERRVLDRATLRAEVGALDAALAALGVRPGDRVAGLLPNGTAAVIAMLACASRGAIWSGCSPDFGPRGVLDRFAQIEPKVLFAADGYRYRGRAIDSLATVREVASQLPSLEAVIVTGYLQRRPEIGRIRGAQRFEDLVATPAEPTFAALPFAHPLYILYSSGTTGAPKCIVHGAGGTLLQHRKEHVLHTDIRPGDVVFYYTTCGWMMWHWLVSALASGATLVLYDGAALYPEPAALWRHAESERINVFGTSASYLSALEKAGCVPREAADLGALRTVLSTGSPLAPASFDFVYRDLKRDVQLASISGGSDIISCFALGNPLLPVYRGELQCRGLGMSVQIFDAQGRAVRGRKGELVCTAPFPSMPLGFWNDPGGTRYRAAYFERFPGVWCHGDYAELTQHDGVIIYGRSDTVLNPGGVRIGTAELYRVVNRFAAVADCVAVAQERSGDTRIVLFVQPRPGRRVDAALRSALRAALAHEASPRHVPAVIAEVSDIPRTRNGKIAEAAVRETIHGRTVPSLDALANPEALEQYRDRPELAG